MTLAVVRNITSARALHTQRDIEDFEQEVVDQFALAMAAANLTDRHIGSCRTTVFEFARTLPGPLWSASCNDADHIGSCRTTVFEFARTLPGPLWSASCNDADSFLAGLRVDGQAHSTRAGKAGMLAQFYDFMISRYQGDIHALTGVIAQQPIDEYNRPSSPVFANVRIPPSETEVDHLFGQWRTSIPQARKYLTAARDYFAASLWRRLGLRINESRMLDIRDWRPDLGQFGKLHVRFGKGSRGRGPKPRMVPAIDGTDQLINWWLTDVRHQFGPDWADPGAPLLPSERHDELTGHCTRIGDDALRSGLKAATKLWLPSWEGRLTPHVLRHFCASSLYATGMDLKALQELLGHEWLSTTTRYIHVRSDHVERAWTAANQRLEARFGEV